MIELSPAQAKRLVINRQGLHKSNAFGRGDSALHDCIDRLGYIQIDTISVINRAHHHTFWTRVATFRNNHLDALQKDRKIFEYWAHAAAYLPMQDYRYCLPYMNAIASGQKHWRTPDKKVMASVMQRIRSDGPLKARDFAASGSKTLHFWGAKKPEKIALEQLFIEGKLMVSHRDGFEKVFDLPERILPSRLDTSTPTSEEFYRYLIIRTIQSQGFATESEIGYLRKGIKLALRKQIQQMLADNEIVQVRVHGNPNVYYSQTDMIEQDRPARVARNVHLLSPFDNLVIQRKRMAQLFDFDYQIECYVPESKRKHGYFCLPILFGDELVGRLDPKADRRNRNLVVRNLVIEKELKHVDAFIDKLARKLNELAIFNGCDSTVIERCNVKQIGSAVSRRLAS
ncbi:hypothetical protein Pla52o_29500 [Novipirellula galeiformis]|uniref:Winged helix-turn-helix domain-containing protein n=1 Tax=Novipirellula galeiformis TaxID=2528004 RepID=A0A5C6CIZ5_9BACT|nr:crosslink repair DNA glycosylase YcaQ family protein [Novipirellula galeiformis]TWU23414.1 hypothetical protein Pla52o_29500 [Novipirellula galeiformis]